MRAAHTRIEEINPGVRPRPSAACRIEERERLLAVRVVTGAAYFHHMNFGCVFTLFAAILAVLRRRTTARFARAFRLPVIGHFENLLLCSFYVENSIE